MAGLRSGVPGGDFFSLSASRSSATLRPGVSATRVGQHGSAPHLGARAELSAEGGSGAHRAPGTPAPAFGTVCLVLISVCPATQGAGAPRPLPARHPRAHSRRSTARPTAGRWLQTDRDAAGKTHERAGPSKGRGGPLDLASSQGGALQEGRRPLC